MQSFEPCMEEMPYLCGIMDWCRKRAYKDKDQRLGQPNLVRLSSSCWLPLWYLGLFEISINSEKGDFFWWFWLLVLKHSGWGSAQVSSFISFDKLPGLSSTAIFGWHRSVPFLGIPVCYRFPFWVIPLRSVQSYSPLWSIQHPSPSLILFFVIVKH